MFYYVLYKFLWIIGSGSEILQETSFGYGSEFFFGFVTALVIGHSFRFWDWKLVAADRVGQGHVL